MKKETKNWIDMVDYDLITVKQMFETGRYVYVIFICHMAIEKALKAIVEVIKCLKQSPVLKE